MTNEKKYVTEINCETGEETTREFTTEEYKKAETARIAWETEKAQAETEAQAKADAKASALAKLAALGLTEDEAKAIAG